MCLSTSSLWGLVAMPAVDRQGKDVRARRRARDHELPRAQLHLREYVSTTLPCICAFSLLSHCFHAFFRRLIRRVVAPPGNVRNTIALHNVRFSPSLRAFPLCRRRTKSRRPALHFALQRFQRRLPEVSGQKHLFSTFKRLRASSTRRTKISPLKQNALIRKQKPFKPRSRPRC